MAEIRTPEDLLAALERSATRVLSPDERGRQEVSFIVGCINDDGNVTKADVEAALAKMDEPT